MRGYPSLQAISLPHPSNKTWKKFLILIALSECMGVTVVILYQCVHPH